MKQILFTVMVVAAIVETSSLVLPVTASLMTAVTLLLGYEAAIIAFVLGIVLDLFAVRLPGQSSIYFLLVDFVAGRYQRKFFAGNFFYTIILLLAGTAGYQFIFYRRIDPEQITISCAIAVGFLWIVNRVGMMEWKKKGLKIT